MAFVPLTGVEPASLSARLTGARIDNFLRPFQPFMPAQASECVSDQDGQTTALTALEHCCNCLGSLTEVDQPGAAESSSTSSRPSIDDSDAMSTVLDFVEAAGIPKRWTYDPIDEDESEEDSKTTMTADNCEKRLGVAKASVIRMIIHLSWDIPYATESAFWRRMMDWTAEGSEREDLISCGLLSLGNGAKNGQSPLSV